MNSLYEIVYKMLEVALSRMVYHILKVSTMFLLLLLFKQFICQGFKIFYHILRSFDQCGFER